MSMWYLLSVVNLLAGDLAGTATTAKAYEVGAYVELYYELNFADPSNGITNLRGFDNTHNSFTLSNAAVRVTWDYADIVGKLALQVGHTPSTYYLAEPARAGSDGANASSGELWKYVQEALVGYRFPLGRGLTVVGGLCLSPVGPEGIPVKDNWNWSRSNLFFGLPFYHTGIKVSYPVTDTLTLMIAGFNGWNNVVDNNDGKSVVAQLAWARPDGSGLTFLYFGGVERRDGAPEGQAWRSLSDVYATWVITPELAILAHADGGFEPNTFGTSGWLAGALYAKFDVTSWLRLAARGDFFREFVASNASGTASAIFWPAQWVAEGTFTIDVHPVDRVSIRLEYRHDHAASDAFFGGAVVGDGIATPFVPNRSSGDTLTLGITGWL